MVLNFNTKNVKTIYYNLYDDMSSNLIITFINSFEIKIYFLNEQT